MLFRPSAFPMQGAVGVAPWGCGFSDGPAALVSQVQAIVPTAAALRVFLRAGSVLLVPFVSSLLARDKPSMGMTCPCAQHRHCPGCSCSNLLSSLDQVPCNLHHNTIKGSVAT